MLTARQKAERLARVIKDYMERSAQSSNLFIFNSAYPLVKLIEDELLLMEIAERDERLAMVKRSQPSPAWPQQEPGIDY